VLIWIFILVNSDNNIFKVQLQFCKIVVKISFQYNLLFRSKNIVIVFEKSKWFPHLISGKIKIPSFSYRKSKYYWNIERNWSFRFLEHTLTYRRRYRTNVAPLHKYYIEKLQNTYWYIYCFTCFIFGNCCVCIGCNVCWQCWI